MSAPPQGAAWAWEWATASEVGGRHEQQDRGVVLALSQPGELLAILADGMGGHLDGAVGAQTAITQAKNFSQAAPSTADPSVLLDQLCQTMHLAIGQQSENARSTVVMVWLRGAQGYWLNVGDSRLYHFRGSQRLMRTRDHSAVQLLMDLGEITEAEMGSHPSQNRLYRSLGGSDTPQPDAGQLTVQPGDLLALCSDGIWEQVSEAELQAAAHATDLKAEAQRLAAQAAQRGGATADNATLILLRPASTSASTAASAAPAGRTPWLQRLLADFGIRTRSGGDA